MYYYRLRINIILGNSSSSAIEIELQSLNGTGNKPRSSCRTKPLENWDELQK